MRRPPMRTVQKFRYQTLKGRFNTYEQYWNRIMRQIEQGTYKRLRRRLVVARRSCARRAEHRRSEAKKAAEGAAALPAVAARPSPCFPRDVERRRARCWTELRAGEAPPERAPTGSPTARWFASSPRRPGAAAKARGSVRFEVGTSNARSRRAKRASPPTPRASDAGWGYLTRVLASNPPEPPCNASRELTTAILMSSARPRLRDRRP